MSNRKYKPVKIGDRFGSWRVIDGVMVDEKGRKWYKCRCNCGFERFMLPCRLSSGNAVWCRKCCTDSWRGASRKKLAHLSDRVARRLIGAVNNALSRCTNENHVHYKDYGGRGITVHEEWLADRSEFVKYLATLTGFDDPKLVLDRIDNNAGYGPGNLRFATPSISLKNRRGHKIDRSNEPKS